MALLQENKEGVDRSVGGRRLDGTGWWHEPERHEYHLTELLITAVNRNDGVTAANDAWL